MVFVSYQTRIFPKTISCHVSGPDRHSAEINVTPTLNKTYTYLKPNLQELDPTHSQLKWRIHHCWLESHLLIPRSLLKLTLTYVGLQGIPETGKLLELSGISEPCSFSPLIAWIFTSKVILETASCSGRKTPCRFPLRSMLDCCAITLLSAMP